jgi:HemY protein
MWRAVTYFILIAILGAGAAWIADQPGEVSLTWLGREITMDIVVAIALIVAVVAGIMLFWALIKLIMGGPQAFNDFLSVRRERSGYSALSSGMLAVGSGNLKLAAKHANLATKLMADEPLTLLLKAQTAQLQGDNEAARRIFDAMLQRSDTELLGLHGLFVEAQRSGDMALSRAYAERAVERQPDLPWAGKAVLRLQSAGHDWDKVEQTIDRNQRNKLISKSEANKKRAALKVSQALEREENNEGLALKLAEDAHGLDPDLVPAAVIASRILSSRGDIRKASRILERTWRKSPHPDIAEIYGDVRPGDSPRDRLKRVKSLAQIGSPGDEGAFAVARAAVDAQAWDDARNALAPYIEARPSQRLCALMAEIEQGDRGDTGRVREWLARAVRAPRDPQWTADGFTSANWLPTSPVTGELGAFQWKVPLELIGAEKEADFTFVEPSGPVVEAEIVNPNTLGEEVKSDTVSRAEQNKKPTEQTLGGGAGLKEEFRSKEGTGTEEKQETEQPFVPPRPPDDPGPEIKKDEEDGFYHPSKAV